MMMRNPHRARVVVQAFVERADLRRSGLFARRAAPNGEHAAARPGSRLEDLTGVAKLAELVRRRQSGEAGAENHDADRRHLTAQVESVLAAERLRRQRQVGLPEFVNRLRASL